MISFLKSVGPEVIVTLVAIPWIWFIYTMFWKKKDKWIKGKFYAILTFNSKKDLKDWYDTNEYWEGIESIITKEGI